MTQSIRSSLIATTIMSLAWPLTVQAQDTRLEEIVVTSRKREESLINVPLAVTAFPVEKIQAMGVQNLAELSKFSPGLSVANQGSTFIGRLQSGIRFRGMNPTVFTPSNQVGALFVDGIFFLAGAQSVGFDDIERVEVIRGPQAAYFGRSTFGGAINYITKDPGDEVGGKIDLEYSPSYDSYAGSASVEGPLVADRVSARLSVSQRQKGDQYTATDGGKLGRERTTSINGTLLFRPTDDLRVKLRATYAKDNDGPALGTLVSYTRFGNCPAGTVKPYLDAAGNPRSGGLQVPWQCGALPHKGVPITTNTRLDVILPPAITPQRPPLPAATVPLDVRAVLVGNSFGSPLLASVPSLDGFGIKRNFQRYSAVFDWTLSDAFTLAGNAAYNDQEGNAIRDGDYSDTTSVYIGAPHTFEDYSGELRLSYDEGQKLRALAGVNYYNQDTAYAFGNAVEATFGFRIPATGPLSRPNPLQNPSSADEISTTGVFGSVEYDILEQLTATFEGRYQVDKVGRFSGSELIGLTREPTYTSKEFLPRGILTWRPIEDMTVYAQYAKGTLPGDNTNLAVFRTLTPGQRDEVQQGLGDIGEFIDSEILHSYEIGLKQSVPDVGLRYSLVGYYMDWKNQKAAATIFLTRDQGRTVGFRVPGTARIKGLEFEGEFAATENLSMNGTLNYTDAEYRDFKLAANAAFFGGTALTGFNAKGNTQPRFPTWSSTLSATWDDELAADWTYYVRGDAIYTGKQYTDETNLTWVSDYTTFNLRVGFVQNEAMTLELFATNLFDQDGWASAAFTFDGSLAQFITLPLQRGAAAVPIDKRSIGARVGYKF
jgi:iron complex outermembrane receptor protein